eukprot:CAMPEP_0172753356 /NCGR_PEP_ID=MMETSP1074-20121228/155784_1 /TAXON_ID=2916 /ORGANISM="Ceratium fusus, Strain PA161109" /LENGTH=84 /DNA_ID=CAMNT_0013586015 /DNA_START=106 /DNA_END=360 /DNA_ORIENTATION=+
MNVAAPQPEPKTTTLGRALPSCALGVAAARKSTFGRRLATPLRPVPRTLAARRTVQSAAATAAARSGNTQWADVVAMLLVMLEG